ncbi:hypothetical protein AB0J01_27820 [Streptomyces sp. NPDC050204]|uniref:hypothetical protein n=1 Tax=Streptomyces sp. NPDC050204 TaxID=3155514 RepID=UPI00344204D9
MPPRRRTTRRSRKPPNEAARLTNVLIDSGFNRRQIAQILGRNSAIVSHFYTRGPGAGGAYVEALRAVVQEVQAGGPRDLDSLKALAGRYVTRRRTKSGRPARVRTPDAVQITHDEEWTSGIARAGKQHISSGASRLAPVLEAAAQQDGAIGFTVRASKGRFLYDSGNEDDSPGVHRNTVQRPDGTEERSYGNGRNGFDAAVWHERVTQHGGDVAAAITHWLVETGRLAEGAKLTNLELRAWKRNR